MGSEEKDLERVAFNRVQPSSQTQTLPDKFKGSTERPEAKPTVKDVYPQIVASCIAHTLVIQAGINMAFSAILLPQLMAPDSTFQIDKVDASWIASLVAIVTPVGALMCGPLMDLLGRKLFSLLVTIPLTLSWIFMVTTSNSVWMLYFNRVLAGFGGGLTTVSMVYISEVTDATWRPMLLCLNSVFVSLGVLLTNALGVLLPWRVVAGFFCILSLLSAIAIAVYNPESPHWLLTFHPDSDKHVEKAKTSLHFLNRNQQMFMKEWDRLLAVRSLRKRETIENRGIVGQLKSMASEFSKRSSVLPLLLLLAIFLFQQLSGTYPIIFYSVQVFQSIGGEFGAGLNADSATVLLGVIRFIMSILTAVLSRTCGRRSLMIVSGTGMTISALAAAIYFQKVCIFNSVFNNNETVLNSSVLTNNSIYLLQTNFSTPLTNDHVTYDSSNIIGLLCILFFVGFGSLGMLIIPWTLVGEILPVTIRGIGGGCLFAFAYILMFFVVKIFPFMLDVFEISGLFYFFGFTAFINVIIVYTFLPETLGKSFDEIEKYFSASHRK